MKRLYLVLLAIAAFCVYGFLLNFQAQHLFPNPAVSVPAPESLGGITVDGAIDATDIKKIRFASKHLCVTPESNLCWDSEPEVIIQ